MNDVRFALRQLRRSPGFTASVIVTLALCIGANTTILSALYGLVLRPLPVENPERLVQMFNIYEGQLPGNHNSQSSWNQYSEYRERDDLFEGCAMRTSTKKIVHRDGEARRVSAQSVTVDFFDLMGAKPLLGRFFLEEETNPGAGRAAVLSQTAWETDYLADPNVIGRQILLDTGVPYTIVGVAPRSLEAFDNEARFTIPHYPTDRERNPARGRYNAHSNDLWLRLKADVRREAALEEVRAMERRWIEEVADADSRRSYIENTAYTRFEFDREHPLEGSLYLLEGGALLILLVGCFNVMTLVVGRVNHKRQELAIRGALGAGKGALRRLMAVECALLAAAAVGAGLILAWGGTHAINEYLRALSPRTWPIAMDGTILGIVLAATLGLVGVLGLLPLEILWKAGLLQRVDNSARGASRGGFSRKLSDGMAVGQAAVAFAMLVGAGLLFRSFQNVMAVDPGFDAAQVIEGRLDWDATKPHYSGWKDAADLKQRVYAGMQEIPGVESVSLSMYNMFSGDLRGGKYVAHNVSPEFFETMGVPILEGRAFRSGDGSHAVVIDESYARRVFPGESPIGQHPHPSGNDVARDPLQRVVGVAARANLRGLEQRDGAAIVYWCHPVEQGSWEYSIFLRASRPANSVIQDMRAKLHEIDPRLPLSFARPLDAALDEMLVNRKGVTWLLFAFAGLALLLAAIGVYAVLAHDVGQRKRELGIRSAVGATRRRLLAMVLRQGLWKAGLGLGIGLLGSAYMTRFLESRLFDVGALDPLTYAAALLVLLLSALAASYLPARRAASVHPTEALRAE